MIEGRVITTKVFSNYDGKHLLLKDIIEKGKVEDEFYVDENSIDKWNYLKGSKKEIRKSKDGYEYNYSEGSMIFPDNLENASRTIIPVRVVNHLVDFKHVIKTDHGLRRLTPIELERLNGFPDNHTKMDELSNTKKSILYGKCINLWSS